MIHVSPILSDATVVAVDAFSLLISLVLIFAIVSENRLKKSDTQIFLGIVFFNGLTVFADMAAVGLQGYQVFRTEFVFTYNCSFVFNTIVLMFFCLYQYHSMSKRAYVSSGVSFGTVFVCLTLCIVWLIGNAQSPSWFISLDKNMMLVHEDAYWMLLFVPMMMLLFNFFLMVSFKSEISWNEFFAWISYELFPFIVYGIFFSSGIYNECIGYAASTLSILLLYTNTHLSEIRQNIEIESRLNKSQMQLMVSQIQPHFMYNSLNSIYALIDIDPEKAQEAVSTFSDYLRQNINSLKTDDPVSFTEELDHTKAYLYLEQVRFADKLKIEYDIQTDDFKIPPLSLQPIVENAVKHGVSKKPEGGTIRISAYQHVNSYEISVVDDGIGFDVSKPPSEGGTHVGLSNVRSRLKAMVDGELKVRSTPGQGTVCLIVIPK